MKPLIDMEPIAKVWDGKPFALKAFDARMNKGMTNDGAAVVLGRVPATIHREFWRVHDRGYWIFMRVPDVKAVFLNRAWEACDRYHLLREQEARWDRENWRGLRRGQNPFEDMPKSEHFAVALGITTESFFRLFWFYKHALRALKDRDKRRISRQHGYIIVRDRFSAMQQVWTPEAQFIEFNEMTGDIE